MRPHRLSVRTQAFQAWKPGSTPGGVTKTWDVFVKPERDGARPGLENFQQKIIVAHIDLHAKHTMLFFAGLRHAEVTTATQAGGFF